MVQFRGNSKKNGIPVLTRPPRVARAAVNEQDTPSVSAALMTVLVRRGWVCIRVFVL